MPDQIYIGNFSRGLVGNRKPFNIDNDAFPLLWNFYSWRGRLKKKRGTTKLGQFRVQIQSVADATPPKSFQIGTLFNLDGSGNGTGFLLTTTIINITQAANAVVTISNNLFEIGDFVYFENVVGMTEINGLKGQVIDRNIGAKTITVNIDTTTFTAYASGGILQWYNNYSSIAPQSVELTDGTNTYEDTNGDGILYVGSTVKGSINYISGAIAITGGVASAAITGKFSYYPSLPVMGLRDYLKNVPQNDPTGLYRYPLLIGFDTNYAYQINQETVPRRFYNVSYYKQTGNPIEWHGTDFQLFWSTNYSNAFWATNNVPGFHFLRATYDSGTGTNAIVFTLTYSDGTPVTNLVVGSLTTGDLLWFNEFGSNIDGQTGYVSNFASGKYTVTFSSNVTVSTNGICQMMTNSAANQDGIRWYDGDPTDGTGLPTANGLGWVNFAPPLTAFTKSIGDLRTKKYYLVGAQAILPFKDRILFFGIWVQSTDVGALPINLQDTVLWSWNGVPYYNSVFPINQNYDVTAYYIDQAGKGGYISAGIEQPIVTVNSNEDVLLVGFTGKQTRFVYTGNDLAPFAFFTINSELGSSATFSGISLDRGGLTFGTYGLALTTQQSSQRIDLEIPDEVFRVRSLDSGAFRVNSIRDFYREWVYFSLPVDGSPWKFPTQTLYYNYRDNTWAVLYESFTAHGNFFSGISKTWDEYTYLVWENWNEPWNSGINSALFPRILGGNAQGYIMIIDENTNEGFQGYITNISANGQFMQITSPNHCLLDANPVTSGGDFIYINNVLGLKNAFVTNVTVSTNSTATTTFTFNTMVSPFTVGKYLTVSDLTGTISVINGNSYEILAATATTVTLDVNTKDLTYTGSGFLISTCNLQIGQVKNVIDENNFVVDIAMPEFTTNYIGGGEYSKLCRPLMQTKQFPLYWEQGRQIRLGVQRYLLDKTTSGQVTLNINLSQDDATVWNQDPTLPNVDATNDSLIYSQVLYTCPESTNLGLLPSEINLQTPTASSQASIWHRINTSLQGETVQIGITLSPEQMRDFTTATSEITLQGMVLTTHPGPYLA
jgi:hypothetical protein